MKIQFLLILLYLEAYSSGFGQPLSHLEHVIQLIKRGEYASAESTLKDIIHRNENDHLAHFYMGTLFLMQDNIDSAIDHLEKSIAIQEGNADYYYRLGQAYGQKTITAVILNKMKFAKRTRNAFQKAVELDSAHIPARIALAQYYIHSPAMMGGGMDKARTQAQAILDMDEIQGRYLQSIIFEKEGDFEAAAIELDRLETLIPDSSDYAYIYQHYGYFLIRQKHPDKAVDKFNRMILLQPDNANSYDCLGDAYRAMGDNYNAAKAYRQALAVNPNFKYSIEKLKEIENNYRRK